MIRRFTIEGFKRFQRETVIDLDDVTVLVGANNSGKSTILHALTLFQYYVETTRRTNGNRPEPGQLALSRRSVRPDEFGVLPVADPGDLWPNGRVRTKGKWNPLSLRAEFDNGATIGFQLQMLYNRFSIVPSAAGHWREAIDAREIRLIPIFSGFLPREEYLTLPARRDRLRLHTSRRAVLRTHAGRAGTDAYRLDFKLLLWDANEIENYVLDRTAILSVLDRQAGKRGVGMEWQQQRSAFVAELDLLLEAQREHVRQSVATRIQQEDRRLALSTALDRADKFLAARWKQPERWCDAKAVLGGLRAWLQSRGLALRIAERDIIHVETGPGSAGCRSVIRRAGDLPHEASATPSLGRRSRLCGPSSNSV